MGNLVEELRSLLTEAGELRRLYEARRYAEAHFVRNRIVHALPRIAELWEREDNPQAHALARELVLELARELDAASDVALQDPSGVILSFLQFGRRRPGRKPKASLPPS